MNATSIQPLLDILFQGKALTREQTASLFSTLIQGEMNEAVMAAMLMALKIRGETIAEISGAADAMRSR